MEESEFHAIEYLKCRRNPFYFIYNYIYIPEIGGSLKLTDSNFHYKMKRVVKSVMRYRRTIFMASRQSGKSTISAALLLWAANFYSNMPIVILNMRMPSGLANLNIIKFMYNHLPEWLRSPHKTKSERKSYIEFVNGSIIKIFAPSPASPPEQLARGLTAPILYIDECAFIRHIGIAYRSAQPIISKASQQAIANNYPSFILITSTPNGTFAEGEFFYNMWNNSVCSDDVFNEEGDFIKDSDMFVNESSKNGFINIIYHWSEDPSKDNNWYENQKRELNFDVRSINQELDLLFIGSTNCIFDDDFLSKLSPKKPIYNINLNHFSQLKIYEELNSSDYYIVGVDTAKSLTGDFCAIEIFSYKKFIQVGEYFGRVGSLTKYSEIVEEVINFVSRKSNNRFVLAIENNSIGTAVVEHLENKNYGSFIYSDKHDKFISGISTSSKSKDTMISLFYDYINHNPSNIKSSDLINQLSIIEKKPNGSISSKSGHNDDLFMASCFCAYVKKMTILEIEPLLNYSQEEISKEEEYLISNMSYSNFDKDDSILKTPVFKDFETMQHICISEEEDDKLYEDSDDLLDYIVV